MKITIDRELFYQMMCMLSPKHEAAPSTVQKIDISDLAARLADAVAGQTETPVIIEI